MHGLGALEHTEGSQQPQQSETMVAMQMRDEDIIEPRSVDTEFLHREDNTLPAVHEEGLIAYLHKLCRRRSRLRRFGTSAA